MISATREGDRIVITAPPTYNDIFKPLPGALYQKGRWTMPLAWSACKQLRAELGELLVVEQPLAAWAQSYLQHRATIESAQRGEFNAPGLDPRLSPQQAAASTWMAWAGRVVMCTEMRTGKTPMTIEALEAINQWPALLVVPNTTKFVWQAEFAEWAPNVCAIVLHGTAAQRRKQLAEAETARDAGLPVAVITNWESLRTSTRLAGYGSIKLSDKEREEQMLNEFDWAVVVGDEAHRAVDPKAKQSRGLKHLAHSAPRRILLTGTPVRNDGSDLYTLWNIVAPEEAPEGRTKWIARYTLSGPGRHGGWEVWGFRPEHQAEMFEVFDPRFLRRTLREMRPGMPDRLPDDVRRTKLDGKQLKIYNDLKKDMIAEVDEEYGGKGLLVVTDPIVLINRLRFAAMATPVIDEFGEVIELTTPSIKIDVLMETLEEGGDEPLVVFMESRKMAELCERELEKAGVPSVSIHGGIDPALRAGNIASFQQGEAKVAVCTVGAGAEGVTLNRASRTLFLQIPYSNVQYLQAKARTDGLAGGDPLETILSITADTIEETYIPILSGKDVTLQQVLRDALRG